VLYLPKIKFGNIDFSGDGAYIWGAGQFSAPSRSVDMIEVPGRSGNLLIDNGNYNNITGSYSVVIMGDVKKNTDRLKHLLYSQKGYQRLYDSDLKGFYRMAAFNSGFDLIEVDAGVVQLTFDCKPFKYDILGENAIEFSMFNPISNLYNKYFEPSRPIITVYGEGSGNVYIGNQTISISNIDEYVTIDAEMQDAFKGLQNKNSTINTADILLLPGNNEINYSGYIQRIEITPRWVTI
jgi:phage-related protein